MARSLGFPLALLLAIVAALVATHSHTVQARNVYTAEDRERYAVSEGVARLRGDDALKASLRRGLRFPILEDSEQPFRSAYNGNNYKYPSNIVRRSRSASRGRKQRQLLTSRAEPLSMLSGEAFYPDLRRGMRFPIVDPARK